MTRENFFVILPTHVSGSRKILHTSGRLFPRINPYPTLATDFFL
jgi:hypothetical protein